MMSLTLVSEAFELGGAIPSRHTCDGEDSSPPLSWTGVPPNVAVFALTLELAIDGPDFLREVFVHWLLFNIPAGVHHLPAGIPAVPRLEDGTVQALNDFERIGYSGPCPPPGQLHHYRFTLYALEAPLNLDAGDSKAQVYDAMVGQILDQAELMGTYQRLSR
ncbi:YbhB/YbcL family Raf kinase inhibitor-like protein [Nitrolancea hollandica]|nr:YbhB/YbcL family Raf kinase inhibitor-like protein [Nitrolancea hollandica]